MSGPTFTKGPWQAQRHPQHDHKQYGELWIIVAGEIDEEDRCEIAEVHAYDTEANARLIAAAPELHATSKEFDRLFLVIESAVRYADPLNYALVLAALKANRAALSKASPSEKGE